MGVSFLCCAAQRCALRWAASSSVWKCALAVKIVFVCVCAICSSLRMVCNDDGGGVDDDGADYGGDDTGYYVVAGVVVLCCWWLLRRCGAGWSRRRFAFAGICDADDVGVVVVFGNHFFYVVYLLYWTDSVCVCERVREMILTKICRVYKYCKCLSASSVLCGCVVFMPLPSWVAWVYMLGLFEEDE